MKFPSTSENPTVLPNEIKRKSSSFVYPHIVVFAVIMFFFWLFFVFAFGYCWPFHGSAFFVEFAAALGIDTEMIKADNKKIIFIQNCCVE